VLVLRSGSDVNLDDVVGRMQNLIVTALLTCVMHSSVLPASNAHTNTDQEIIDPTVLVMVPFKGPASHITHTLPTLHI
jgi:hypothetical protein